MGAEIGASWLWIIGGLLLAACELVAPGIFLIWLGLAAVVTGMALAIVTVSWPIQALVFAALAIVAVLVGRQVMHTRPPDLNRRGYSLVGRDFVLDHPIAGGVGRLQLGDTSWRVTGPDLPAGAHIRIVALDGSTLVAEAISDPASPAAFTHR